MALSWNEIKDRPIKFSKEWKTETRELSLLEWLFRQ